MAAKSGDIFIVGRMVFIENAGAVRRVEIGPRINLSHLIRNMKFPEFVKKNAAEKVNRRVILLPKPEAQSQLKGVVNNLSQISTSSHPNETAEVPRVKKSDPVASADLITKEAFETSATVNEDASRKQPPHNIEINRDEGMFQRAFDAFSAESKKTSDVSANADAASLKQDINDNEIPYDEKLL